MSLVHGALSRHGGHDGDLCQLGKFLKFRAGTGVEDPLPRPDSGHSSVEELIGDVADVAGGRCEDVLDVGT